MELMDASKAQTTAADVRENYARDVFKLEQVMRLIKQAVAAGKTQVRVTQEQPLDLSGTSAAQAVVKRLIKRGYHVMWVDAAHAATPKKSVLPQCDQYQELVVYWG